MDTTRFPLSPRVTRYETLRLGIRRMFGNLFRPGTPGETLQETLHD
jgi:hypothetical protein